MTDLDVLVGKYFHIPFECPGGKQRPNRQGKILGCPGGMLLIETYTWGFTSASYGQEFMTFEDFASQNPILYEDFEEMDFSYQHGRMSHECSARCESLPSNPRQGKRTKDNAE